MKPTVVLTHHVYEEVIDYLANRCDVIPNATRETLDRDEILRRCRHAEGLMVFMPDRVDEAFLEACPRLRVISGALKGYDNFDVDACTRHGVLFTIVSDLLAEPTADLAVGLLLGITRQVLAGDRWIRSGKFRGWLPRFYGTGLAGRTLGIIGMGAVGKAVAKRARAFSLRVIYNDTIALPDPEEAGLGVQHVGLDEILRESDFVMPLLPLTPATFRLVDGAAISRMKVGSYIINVARGSIVDEHAVAEALRSGLLAGYAADVFEMEDWARENRPTSIPQSLLELSDRTLFTPHLGSAVVEVRNDIERVAARHIVQALDGKRPDGAVNDVSSFRGRE